MENTDWMHDWTSIKGAWAPWPNMYSYKWLFSRQNKNLNEKSSSRFLLTAKMLQETMHFIFSYLDQITYN